ncbi:MAG: hypothetical protein ACREQ7_08340, partial [Candidatus Binatia bacterium]
DIPRRTPDWVEKKLMHWHAVFEIPKGFRFRHPAFEPVPPLDKFVQSDTQRKVMSMFRNFRLIGSPYILPPKTPKEVVATLREAFRKAFDDRDFPKAWKGFTGADPYPLLGKEQEMAIKEIPRDPEAIKIFTIVAGAEPLPSR